MSCSVCAPANQPWCVGAKCWGTNPGPAEVCPPSASGSLRQRVSGGMKGSRKWVGGQSMASVSRGSEMLSITQPNGVSPSRVGWGWGAQVQP